jgi:hypothetical protein
LWDRSTFVAGLSEVVLEIISARQIEIILQVLNVLMPRLNTPGCLPRRGYGYLSSDGVLLRNRVNFIIVVDRQQLVLNEVVVWPLLVRQFVNVIENCMHLRDFSCRPHPQATFRRF